MSKSTVSIKKVENYDFHKVKNGIIESLKPLGGISSFVTSGQKVLLKPNLLAAASPEKAVTTHPILIAAVTSIVKDAGGIVMIGDSPGVGDLFFVEKSTGVSKIVEEFDAELADFSNEYLFECEENVVGKKMMLAKAVADADIIISLPKLKTHVQMTMTCAVKNQFGLVLGMEKGQYHFRLKAREALADIFVDINRIAKPVLAICDAIDAMEGEGPGGGEPRHIGLIISSADLMALDVIACKIIGLNPDLVPTIQAGKRQKFGETDLDKIEVIGEKLEDISVDDFKQISNLKGVLQILPFPNFMLEIFGKLWAAKPRIIEDKCIKCYKCRDGCPVAPSAIDPDIPSKNKVNDKTCIRCYCCHEFCPVKAIKLKQSWIDRTIKITKSMNWFNKVFGKFIPHI